jgi:DNA-binding transcriptional LysR family regulator
VRISMDPGLLGLVQAIQEHGSFNRAATALGMSQPALSVKIAQLERQAGARLFERGPRGTWLTRDGEIVLAAAHTIETVCEKAAIDLQHRSAGIAGPLLIGATPVALVDLVPEAINRLDRELSGLAVQIFEGPDAALNEQLRRHAIDAVIGVVNIDAATPGITEHVLMEDPLNVVTRPGTPLDRRCSVRLEELSEARWVLPEPGSSFRLQIDALFLTAGQPFPEGAVLCASLLAIRRTIMVGQRMAILPRQAVRQDAENGLLTSVALDHPGSVRRVGVRLRAGETPAPLVRRFVEHLDAVAASLGRAMAGGC